MQRSKLMGSPTQHHRELDWVLTQKSKIKNKKKIKKCKQPKRLRDRTMLEKYKNRGI
jgi:hypothetical protein